MIYVNPTSMSDSVRRVWAQAKEIITQYERREEWVHTLRVNGLTEERTDYSEPVLQATITFKCCRIVRDFWVLYVVMWKDEIIDVLDAIPRGDLRKTTDELHSTTQYRLYNLPRVVENSELFLKYDSVPGSTTPVLAFDAEPRSPYPTFNDL